MGKNKRVIMVTEGSQTQAAMQEAMGDDADVLLSPPLPPETPTPEDEAQLAAQVADEVEVVSDPPLPPETPTPEDEAQLAAHEGFQIYEEEWNFCLTMAFMHTGADMLTDWGDIPFCMASFMLANPKDTPVAAALMEVKLRKGVVILPNEDQRRVLLALELFRTYVLGWHMIEREDVAAQITADEQARYAARAPQKLDLTDTPYETVDGPFDASDLGKGR
jgi:hypothetical protein